MYKQREKESFFYIQIKRNDTKLFLNGYTRRQEIERTRTKEEKKEKNGAGQNETTKLNQQRTVDCEAMKRNERKLNKHQNELIVLNREESLFLSHPQTNRNRQEERRRKKIGFYKKEKTRKSSIPEIVVGLGRQTDRRTLRYFHRNRYVQKSRQRMNGLVALACLFLFVCLCYLQISLSFYIMPI